MSMLDEFKTFAMRGSVVDLAIGVIIGAAFGKVVSSLVSDVIMPPIGMVLGGVDFSDLAITLKSPLGKTAPVEIKTEVAPVAVAPAPVAAAPVAQPESHAKDAAKKDETAPLCYNCGNQTQRAGSCYVCTSCGSTTGCS